MHIKVPTERESSPGIHMVCENNPDALEQVRDKIWMCYVNTLWGFICPSASCTYLWWLGCPAPPYLPLVRLPLYLQALLCSQLYLYAPKSLPLVSNFLFSSCGLGEMVTDVCVVENYRLGDCVAEGGGANFSFWELLAAVDAWSTCVERIHTVHKFVILYRSGPSNISYH